MEIYTIKQVAEMYQVNLKTIYNWIYSGKLKATRLSGSVRVSKKDLDEFIQKSSKD